MHDDTVGDAAESQRHIVVVEAEELADTDTLVRVVADKGSEAERLDVRCLLLDLTRIDGKLSLDELGRILRAWRLASDRRPAVLLAGPATLEVADGALFALVRAGLNAACANRDRAGIRSRQLAELWFLRQSGAVFRVQRLLPQPLASWPLQSETDPTVARGQSLLH